MKVNPMIVFRDEGEDGGILFDPDTGDTFGLNPTAKFIWRQLSEGREPEEIFTGMTETFEHLPSEARADLDRFVQSLQEYGYLIVE